MDRICIENSKAILEDTKQAKSVDLRGDGGFDSPGHNAKSVTYSFMVRVQIKLDHFH